MENRQVDKRKTAWAAACAIIFVYIVLLFAGKPDALAEPLGISRVNECTVICSTCNPVVFKCDDEGGGGGYATPPGGGGNPTNVPPGEGGTPRPVATQRPAPTVIPPTGAPGGGYYTTVCVLSAEAEVYGCPGSGAILTIYVSPSGAVYVVGTRCVPASTCAATPTPPPGPGPTPTPEYPCNTPPQPGGDTITQPCTGQWPGYNLSVSVRIPPVNMARNPWPRSLVGLETQLCFSSAPDDEEQFSAQKAVPCNVDRGTHTDGEYECGGATGEVGEGDQVNYQLGVAWRRFTGSDPGYGTVPPFRSALQLADRDWNGGSRMITLDPGQCTAHTYETSSYGLDETGEAWNPACQDRDCAYTERTLPVNRACEACEACTCDGCYPAYDAFIQTWWWPEWTWRYDQYQCVQTEPDDCFYDPNPGGRRCSHGAHAGESGWKETVSCVAWSWRNIIEPWRQYDVRRQGLPLPYLGSGRTNAAGMTPERQIMTPFQYSPSVPVIEIQPVK